MQYHDELLEKLEKSSRQQALFTKILCVLCAVVLICSVITTAAVAGTAKQLSAVVIPLQEVTAQVQDMTGQAEIILDNMESVTQALAEADLGSMVENVNVLAAESQSVVSGAMEKLDTIDIDMLNKAIRDLSDVVEPLAKVSKLFG